MVEQVISDDREKARDEGRFLDQFLLGGGDHSGAGAPEDPPSSVSIRSRVEELLRFIIEITDRTDRVVLLIWSFWAPDRGSHPGVDERRLDVAAEKATPSDDPSQHGLNPSLGPWLT